MSVFKSIEEHDHWRAVVRLNPKRDKEPLFHYLERIAVLAGGMEPGSGILGAEHQWDDTPRVRVTPPEREVRLPYKDSPDEEDRYADIEVPF